MPKLKRYRSTPGVLQKMKEKAPADPLTYFGENGIQRVVLCTVSFEVARVQEQASVVKRKKSRKVENCDSVIITLYMLNKQDRVKNYPSHLHFSSVWGSGEPDVHTKFNRVRKKKKLQDSLPPPKLNTHQPVKFHTSHTERFGDGTRLAKTSSCPDTSMAANHSPRMSPMNYKDSPCQ